MCNAFAHSNSSALCDLWFPGEEWKVENPGWSGLRRRGTDWGCSGVNGGDRTIAGSWAGPLGRRGEGSFCASSARDKSSPGHESTSWNSISLHLGCWWWNSRNVLSCPGEKCPNSQNWHSGILSDPPSTVCGAMVTLSWRNMNLPFRFTVDWQSTKSSALNARDLLKIFHWFSETGIGVQVLRLGLACTVRTVALQLSLEGCST